MAHYLVRARPRQTRLAQLASELEARAFIDLRPFGRAEERAAVLDAYFDDIRVEPVARGEGWRALERLPRLFPALGGT